MYTQRAESGCLEWTGALTRDGYGKITSPRRPDDWASGQRTGHVHRLVVELASGQPVPDDMHVDHLCRNRLCCEIDHLQIVPPRGNVLAPRSQSPGAINIAKTHCKHGHLFDEQNTRWYQGANGRMYRACRACRRFIYPSTREAHMPRL
jgi:hypothetical protein